MIMMSHFAEGYATIIKVIKSPTAGRFVHGVLVMLGAVQWEKGRLDTVQQPEGVLGSYAYGLVAAVLW